VDSAESTPNLGECLAIRKRRRFVVAVAFLAVVAAPRLAFFR